MHLGQFNDPPKATNVDSLGFLQHSLTIVKMISAGILLTTLIVYIFRLTNSTVKVVQDLQQKKRRFAFECLRSIGYFIIFPSTSPKLSRLNLIMISFALFLQVLLALLTNSIKTNDGKSDDRRFVWRLPSFFGSLVSNLIRS